MYKNILILMSVLIVLGCSQKIIYQVDGIPILDNIVRAEIIRSDLVIKYMILENFYEYEESERYKSQNFINVMSDDINKISNDSHLQLKIYVFNPKKVNYKIKTVFVVGKTRNVVYRYNGKLSRNDLNILLPLTKGEIIQVYFEVLGCSDEMQYRSFKTKYII